MGLYFFILVVWNAVGFVVLLNTPKLKYGEFIELYHPREIYDAYKVNKFGSFIIALGIGLVCPVMCIIWWICHFIYWICTVGRDE